MIDKNHLTSINRIVMYVWLGMAVLGLIVSGIIYFSSESEGISTYLVLSLICFMMYGWKRFQVSKFS
ncbi:MAG: hypothetical protein QMB45_01765 [Flavobacteriales bacterium]|jgi:hypothetical protein